MPQMMLSCRHQQIVITQAFLTLFIQCSNHEMDLGSDSPHSVMALLPTGRAEISAMGSDGLVMGLQLRWQLIHTADLPT